VDTLVASRLLLPNIDDLDDQATALGDTPLGKLRGRYRLEAWGLRFGIPKTGADIEDWSAWTPEMQERCAGDVMIGKALWCFLQPDGYSQQALELEHRVAKICDRITTDGVPFDTAAAEQLHEKWTARRSELEAQLQQQFPGTNLNSRMQIGALLEARGWTPRKRTEKTKQPVIDDEVLATIPELFPEFTGFAEYELLRRRTAQLATGKKAWLSNIGDDGRIHGALIHVGTPHGRAKHLEPNLAQVPNAKKGAAYAAECRALFRHPGDWVFVTCDQANLQDRAFAHYLTEFDGGAYAQAFLAGIDQHWQNAIALGLVPAGTERDKESKFHTAIREGAKHFRYGFLFGAGATRCGEILTQTVRAVQQIESTYTAPMDGKRARDRFMAATPGLQHLRNKLESQVLRHQWLTGLDGRRIPTRAQYAALNYALTSVEAIVCKRWLVQTYDELCERFNYGWDGDVAITLWIHDEIAVCCRPEIAAQVGEILVRNAKEAGAHFQLKVPLDAEYKIGRSCAGEPVGDDQRTNAETEIAADEVENSKPHVLDRTSEAKTDNGHANGDRGDVRPAWLAPASIEVPSGSAEFAAILASLPEQDCAVVRAPEVPGGNGQDQECEKPIQATKLNRSTSRASSKIICPFHDDHDPSLELYADGHYHCYACEAHGAIEELPEAASAPTPDAAQTDPDTFERGIQLWQAANPIRATLAERYLTKIRNLDLTILPDIDAVLRFHPRCPFDGNKYPCVLALFRGVENDTVAGIHRIALTANAEKIGRKMLGAWPRPRAIKLRPTGEKLLIGEGIETTMGGSMKVRWSSALWACGSAGAIAKLPLFGHGRAGDTGRPRRARHRREQRA
jgi:DNA polymerase I-like protein with 3'-5' exonuclease and polymerase domains